MGKHEQDMVKLIHRRAQICEGNASEIAEFFIKRYSHASTGDKIIAVFHPRKKDEDQWDVERVWSVIHSGKKETEDLTRERSNLGMKQILAERTVVEGVDICAGDGLSVVEEIEEEVKKNIKEVLHIIETTFATLFGDESPCMKQPKRGRLIENKEWIKKAESDMANSIDVLSFTWRDLSPIGETIREKDTGQLLCAWRDYKRIYECAQTIYLEADRLAEFLVEEISKRGERKEEV